MVFNFNKSLSTNLYFQEDLDMFYYLFILFLRKAIKKLFFLFLRVFTPFVKKPCGVTGGLPTEALPSPPP
jgi:hypothetical protein